VKTITTLLATALFAAATADAKPLKVFILAGQSNMEGPAGVKTFDYIGDDPATAPMLKMMQGADGKPTVCDGAWISYLTGENNFEIAGKLTAGYGSMWGLDPTKPGDKIGPEFTFGLTMDAALAEPVLLIKAAWGGKSLHTDFRPPSAGPYQLSSFQRENYPKQEGHGIPKDFEQWKLDKAKATGHYYRLMIGHVRKVLDDVKRVYPDYDSTQGYELGAIADKHEKVNQMRYFLDAKHKDHPNADGHMTEEQKSAYMKKYEADLITPAEVALWKRGASNAGYHYLGCAKTFALMGNAFAEANLKMLACTAAHVDAGHAPHRRTTLSP